MALLQKVKLKMPNGSNFNRSKKHRTTLAPGVIAPVYHTRMLPGDKISIKTTAVVKTLALMAPTMGSFVLQLDHFFAPDRLYVPEFRSNSRSTDFTQVEKPYVQFDGSDGGYINSSSVDTKRFGVPPGSLHNLLGFPVGYQNYAYGARRFSAFPFLVYDDIFYNWYANVQEDSAPIIVNNRWSEGQVPFSRHSLDTIREAIDDVANGVSKEYEFRSKPGPYQVYSSASPEAQLYRDDELMNGLWLSTYKPDMFTTFLDKDKADQIQLNTRVQADENGYITIDQIRMMYKKNNVDNRDLVAGNRYTDHIAAQWGVTPTDLFTRPEFLGSSRIHLTFDDIVSQSNTVAQGEDVSTGLGDLGGICRGLMNSGNFKFFSPEFGTYMIIARIIPMPDYFQGLSCEWSKLKYCDEFLPGYDGIGFRDLMRSEMYAVPSFQTDIIAADGATITYGKPLNQGNAEHNPFGIAIGKVPAYIEYMTDTNSISGLFANDELRYWTLAREVGKRQVVGTTTSGETAYSSTAFDFSSYINPADYNDIFVDTRLSAMNFMCQFAFDVKHRRLMNKNPMPTWNAY